MRWFPVVIFTAILLSPSCLRANPPEDSSAKLQKVYSLEDQGVSFTADGNIIPTDNKIQAQSAISIVSLPRRAKVVKAFLYWSGEVLSVSSADTSVDLIPPSGRIRKVYAEDVWSALSGGQLGDCGCL